MTSSVGVRLVAALAALVAGAVAVALAVLLLQHTPGPVSSAAPAAPAAAAPTPVKRFPAPPAHAIVFAREDGPNVLALAVTNSSAQVSVVGQQGNGIVGLVVRVNGVRATSCGSGCYRVPTQARTIDVRAGKTEWRVAVPAARDAGALVAKAGHVWRSLHTLVFTDRLGSDQTHVVDSTWRVQAPNRLSYVIRGGGEAIIVGGRRWDRTPHGRWVESPTTELRQPVPLWQSATDANVVGQTSSTWRITFYDPGTPAWFAVTVDKRTSRTLDVDMTTTAHFMHERYGRFDAPLTISAPG